MGYLYMTQEALKLALEALSTIAHNTTDDPRGQAYKAITAIKEALAQTQEPVGQLLEEAYGRGQVMWFNKPKDQSMLYTAPPQRTEQDTIQRLIALVRTHQITIDKLEAQPEQEPVAWIDEFGNVFPLGAQRGPKHLNEPMKPLYTTPPQRTWVGLTDREKSNLWLESRAAIPRFHTYAALVEAKLKEKNT